MIKKTLKDFYNKSKTNKFNKYDISINSNVEYYTKNINIITNNNKINIATFLYENDNYKTPQFIILDAHLHSINSQFHKLFFNYTDFLKILNNIKSNINIIREYYNTYEIFKLFDIEFDNKKANEDYIYILVIIVIFITYHKIFLQITNNNINKNLHDFIIKNNNKFFSIYIHAIDKNDTFMLESIDIIYNTFENNYPVSCKIFPNFNNDDTEYSILNDLKLFRENNIIKGVTFLYDKILLKNFEFTNVYIKDKKRACCVFDMEKYVDYVDDSILNLNDTDALDLDGAFFNEKGPVYILVMSYIGRPIYELPFFINTMIKYTTNDFKPKNKNDEYLLKYKSIYNCPYDMHYEYIYKYDFSSSMFNFIYTLLFLNMRLNIIHNNINLNNITFQQINKTYFYNYKNYKNIINKNNLEDTYDNKLNISKKINNIAKNLYIIGNKSYVINNHNIILSIIDFSKSIKINNDNYFINMIVLISELFPMVKKDKIKYNKLINYVQDKKISFEIFKIMSGYDLYATCDNLLYLFKESNSHTQQLKDNYVFLQNIKNDCYKFMYKNINKLLHDKNVKFEYTNKIIIDKYYLSSLTSKFNNDMFYNLKDDTVTDDDILECYYNNKKIILNMFDIKSYLPI